MQLVLIGPPGAGKGTVAGKVAARYKLAHLSTGDILREAIARGTALGARANEYVETGRLVPQEVLGAVVAERLREAKDFVLDGYPRTLEQAEFLSSLPYVELDAVVYVVVPEEEAVSRLAGRLVCSACGGVTNADDGAAGICEFCGSGRLEPRADDQPDTVRKRYEVYMAENEPVVEYYRAASILREVDGTGNRKEVFARVEAAVKALVAGGDDNR
jgi:adenylate kinase